MKNLPVRKLNRLKNYDYSQNGAYFITICVENRAEIFGKIENNKMVLNKYGQIVYEEWLKTESLRRNVKLHEFVVMPNHFHAIIEIKCDVVIVGTRRCLVRNENNDNPTTGIEKRTRQRLVPTVATVGAISAIVGSFKSIVSRRMHEIGWFGKIWQRSFHDHIIRDENDYRRISEYIETNPQKWFDDCFYSDKNLNC